MALTARFAEELQPDDDDAVVLERSGRLYTASRVAAEPALLAGVERIADIRPGERAAAPASTNASALRLTGTRGVLDYIVRKAGSERLGLPIDAAPSPFKRPVAPEPEPAAPEAPEPRPPPIAPPAPPLWERIASAAAALLHAAAPPPAASGVRALAWHPAQPVLAVASAADDVRLHRLPAGLSSPAAIRHERQAGLRCLAWKPLGNYLAVGARGAVLVWRVDLPHAFPAPAGGPRAAQAPAQGFGKIVPTADGGRPTPPPPAGLAAILPASAPVSSLAWSPTGEWQLAAASAADGAVVLWDVAEGQGTALRRLLAGPGATLVSWAPAGDFLLAAFADGSVRVWECAAWRAESLALPAPAAAAAWVAGGKTAVLAAGTALHSLSFARTASGVAVRGGRDDYIGEAPVQTRSGETRTVGGAARLLAADARGERLAVGFGGGARLALLAVSPAPFPDFLPIGAAPAAGREGALQAAAFACGGVRGSALLALGWASGAVTFLPFA